MSTTKAAVAPYNSKTGKAYQGKNINALMQASDCREWATFLQWNDEGYKVKKGSKGTGIRTFVATIKKDEKTGESESGYTPRYYTVFNRDQVEKKS
jgi:antirestriction protein ArdC